MRIALFGTPEFAVPTLEALAKNPDFDLCAVVTQCDRPVGRKAVLTPPPVKVRAQELGVDVLQIEKINQPESLQMLRALACDVFVTAAYGQILSQKLLDIPPQGVVNVHASLLPKYRGASPIAWSIRCGEAFTGITTMFTDAGVDTGDIILQRQMPIEPDDTTQTLTQRLAVMGAEVLIATLYRIMRNQAPRYKQDESLATRTPILTRMHGKIDFTGTARQVDCLVRAMTPWPGTFTKLHGKTLKVFAVEVCQGRGVPGTVLDDQLTVACGEGAVRLLSVQLEGGRRMQAKDFLRGRAVQAGTVLGEEA